MKKPYLTDEAFEAEFKVRIKKKHDVSDEIGFGTFFGKPFDGQGRELHGRF